MKRFLSLMLVLALAVCGALAVHADELPTEQQTVTFNTAGKMVSSYGGVEVSDDKITSDVTAKLSEMQPGDSATFSIVLKNDYAESTDWYMINDVLNSLEKAAEVASGGAYTYDLEYDGPGGHQILYNNERVGGETGGTEGVTRSAGSLEGLEYATTSLGEQFFYLDTLGRGQSGRLSLRVMLDGETQGNSYQDTLAQLIMQFGVELTPESTVERRIHHELVTSSQYNYRPVKTGDESRILLWSLVMLLCGLAALVLAVYNHRKARRERG